MKPDIDTQIHENVISEQHLFIDIRKNMFVSK